MNEGLSGWYGVVMIFLVLGFLVTVGGVLGAAALRYMLNDETYFPDES